MHVTTQLQAQHRAHLQALSSQFRAPAGGGISVESCCLAGALG